MNPLFKSKVEELTKHFHSKKITIPEFKRMKSEKKDIVIIDVREEEEFRVSHLLGALNVGYKKFDLSDFLAKIPRTKKIVAYCSVGYRSGEIADKLKKEGYEVHNLLGGLFEWINQGHEVYTDDLKKIKRIHTYNRSWGQWVSAPYEKIY